MTNHLPLVSLILALSLPLCAQTTYTQSAPQHCSLSEYYCNQIPLNGGGVYNFILPFPNSTTGSFTLDVPGINEYNSTGVSNAAMPTLRAPAGPAGTLSPPQPFSFDFAIPGHTGTVKGTIQIEKVCGRYCWPLAWIESSTVTLN